MWVARDKNGILWLGHCKPKRVGRSLLHPEKDPCIWDFFTDNNYYIKNNIDEMSLMLPNNFFPNLHWEDEPLEIELITKSKVKKAGTYGWLEECDKCQN